MLSQARTEERQVEKERGTENIKACQHPVRRVISPAVNTALHEHECADHQVCLIARDDRPTVDPPKRRTSGDSIHRAKS